MCKKFKEPEQWIYVIEKSKNQVKVGVSKNYIERIKYLERTGGFFSLRCIALGPYQNGYEVESKILARLKKYRTMGEWHCVSYEDAVATAKEVAKKVGNSSVVEVLDSIDLVETVDELFPLRATININEHLQDTVITGFVGEKKLYGLKQKNVGYFYQNF